MSLNNFIASINKVHHLFFISAATSTKNSFSGRFSIKSTNNCDLMVKFFRFHAFSAFALVPAADSSHLQRRQLPFIWFCAMYLYHNRWFTIELQAPVRM